MSTRFAGEPLPKSGNSFHRDEPHRTARIAERPNVPIDGAVIEAFERGNRRKRENNDSSWMPIALIDFMCATPDEIFAARGLDGRFNKFHELLILVHVPYSDIEDRISGHRILLLS
jgi:hypothetical protein